MTPTGQEREAPREVWLGYEDGHFDGNVTFNDSRVGAFDVRYVRADLVAAVPEPNRWQPIETAPKNTDLLVGRFVGEEWRVCQSGYYYDGGSSLEREPACWYWSEDFDSGGVTSDEGPTHWRPLPPAPEVP